MSLISNSVNKLQDAPFPDFLTRPAIALLVANARKALKTPPADAEATFAREMAERPVAEHTDAANQQHYELPARFFELCLGPHRKYSSCFYESDDASLGEAEASALRITCEHADIRDGQSILELGCGWGSLSLWMAERYPNANITAVSNSHSQKASIDETARRRGLTNLTIITADMNDFMIDRTFDRIVSVEMFEHMANWRALLGKARGWLKPEGRMFIHVFSHIDAPYRFEVSDQSDFIAQHFFTGGVMPSHGLMRQYGDLLTVEDEWRWSGTHYQRTADDWLDNFDMHEEEIRGLMASVYGPANAPLWMRRWRRFFMATAGLFGDSDGQVWGVSHYRLKRA
ncbi:SAM-dependent methyltransferase [Brevundimonas goettingensis]|uniref:Class I SAM-dependent methyltransferase n=1 Tax=Brevundimonas goettingensis TaxID=2774190 RepID=A0A975C0Y0_9CAUL|nr:cyclopropane-fatty-acyl-phospholipid synthase family protein [Brevundimonas goettingensis]QTC91848.1 class I SAM-dependent methyltransferase [Brevundimonas goettingensis]